MREAVRGRLPHGPRWRVVIKYKLGAYGLVQVLQSELHAEERPPRTVPRVPGTRITAPDGRHWFQPDPGRKRGILRKQPEFAKFVASGSRRIDHQRAGDTAAPLFFLWLFASPQPVRLWLFTSEEAPVTRDQPRPAADPAFLPRPCPWGSTTLPWTGTREASSVKLPSSSFPLPPRCPAFPLENTIFRCSSR